MSQETAIEKLVQARKTAEARKLINQWLKSKKAGLAPKIQASSWLKRLGLNRDAYRLIAPKEWNFSKTEKDSEYRACLIWAARLLNLMGAPRYALQVLNKIKGHDPALFLSRGNLYLSQYQAKEALLAYDAYFAELPSIDKKSYDARLTEVSRADALDGVGKSNDALQALLKIQIAPHEELLRGIIHQARGEYFAHLEEWDQAHAELTMAESFFPSHDESTDLAFLKKWQAFVEVKCGKNKNSDPLKKFNSALKIFHRPDQKPETWLDCFALMNELGLLEKTDQEILHSYPGAPSDLYLRRKVTLPPRPLWIGSEDSEIALFPGRQEHRVAQQSRYGYPKEAQLLELVRRSGKYGISIERVKSLLWPEDFSSFFQLDARVSQLIKRIREHWGCKVMVQDRLLIPDPSLLKSVSVEFRQEIETSVPPTFFTHRREFSTKELSEYYGLKKTNLFKVLAAFETQGWIKKETKNRKTSYLILTNS